MNLSIKKRIYWSFALLVLLFVINAITSIITLNENIKLSRRVSAVIDPSLHALEDFQDMLVESKMYATNWVFLRSNLADKDALQKLHNSDYPKLKIKLNSLFFKLDDKSMEDSLNNVFAGFEQLIAIEKKIMSSLQKFQDYNDPVAKFESERIIEDEVLPRTSNLTDALTKIVSNEQAFSFQENKELQRSFLLLRKLISALAIIIICISISFSVYFGKIIIGPIDRIRNIINDLGKGILQKVTYKENKDEIGEMIHAVNNLSEKLKGTATFAREVGSRNFDVPFRPLSDEDVLGKALITMRDNLKQSESELVEANAEIQTIYDASLDAVIIIDEQGKIIKWDHKSELLFGWKENELTGTLLTESIIPHRYREAHQRGMKHFLQTGDGPILARAIEISALTKDNVEFDISLSISPVLIKDKYRFIGFIRDITSRKKAEAKLRQSETELELNNKELVQKNRELEQFAYVASHDLQEPLSTTISFAELFKQQYSGKLDPKADKYLTYIIQASDRMRVLIKDLLDFSRIGHSKDVEKVDCNLILRNVIADLDVAIKNSGAIIKSEYLPAISGYATEMKQLFQNLVVNSIKFSKKNIRPRINITAHKKDDYWQFAFSDNGIGIDPQHSERIFIIFQRLHTRSEYQGSGIGLSHCKKIVELHHGKIWVESIPNEGSTFYFTIHSPKEKINEPKIKLHNANR
jgi:PAS domain S-box-containing protein